MLCMKFDDITSLKLKVRRNGDRTSLDAKHEAAIRKWNKLVWFSKVPDWFTDSWVSDWSTGSWNSDWSIIYNVFWKPFPDSALYDHFLTKLNDKIIKYGEEKMLEDLKTLQGKIQSPYSFLRIIQNKMKPTKRSVLIITNKCLVMLGFLELSWRKMPHQNAIRLETQFNFTLLCLKEIIRGYFPVLKTAVLLVCGRERKSTSRFVYPISFIWPFFQMSWGEVKFGDDLRETQKLQLKRKRKLIQPKMEDLINRLKEEQIKILGKEAVENSK